VTVVLVIALVLVGTSLLGLLFVPVVAAAVILVMTVPLVRGLTPLAPGLNRADWARLLRITPAFAAATAIGVLYSYLAVVLMSLVSTHQQTGFFGASFRVFVVLGGIPGLLVVSAFPLLARAARDDQERLAYALQRLWDTSLILGVGIALCTAIGATLAIDVVAGSGFKPSIEVLRIQAGAVLASYFVAIWGYALLSLGRYRALLVANAVALALSATLTLTLAPGHGAKGAAVATLVGECSLAAAYAFALMRKRPDLRPSLDVVLPVAVAAASAGAMVFVPGLHGVARLTAAGVTYVAVLWVLRAVPDEIAHALREWLPGRRA
jgi:O-antigen/teichoic acid export membrane protein